MILSEILNSLDRLAPFSLAYDWDNSGLQIGDRKAEIDSALICLDLSQDAVDKAIEMGCQLIVSHHPLIFSPQKSITLPLHLRLIENRIAVVSMHTNLDVAPAGVTHCLAEALGLSTTKVLSSETGSKWFHLSVTVPIEALAMVQEAAFMAGAGRVGNYDCCSTSHPIDGSVLPLKGSNPTLGDIGSRQKVVETELELMVDSFNLPVVLSAIQKAHPYETPAIYYYPVQNSNPAYGLGLLCTSKQAFTLRDLKDHVALALHNPKTMLWTAGKAEDTLVTRIALCGGSGNSIISRAASVADVLITGDITYHNLLDSSIPIIDAGHLYTEFPVLHKLQDELRTLGLKVSVLPLSEHDYERRSR